MTRTPRSVRFVVVSSHFDADQITEHIGLAPDAQRVWTRSQPHQHSWEIRIDGSTSDDVSTMIDAVLIRLATARERLIDLCTDSATSCRLRLVLYVENDERVRVGPGFAVSAEHLRFLAAVNASIDADLYGVGDEPEDSA